MTNLFVLIDIKFILSTSFIPIFPTFNLVNLNSLPCIILGSTHIECNCLSFFRPSIVFLSFVLLVVNNDDEISSLVRKCVQLHSAEVFLLLLTSCCPICPFACLTILYRWDFYYIQSLGRSYFVWSILHLTF